MKKIAIFLLSSTLLCAEQSNTDQEIQCECDSDFCHRHCPQPCCPEIVDCCACNVCPPTWEITPKGGPCVECGWGGYGTIDFIYWGVQEDHLEFAATSGFSDSSPGSPTPINTPSKRGKIYSQRTHWRPGFKVGMGIDFCHDGWDFYTNYTFFRLIEAKRSKSNLPGPVDNAGNNFTTGLNLTDSFWGIGGALTPIGHNLNNAQAVLFTTLKQRWTLHFNTLDFEIGRNFYISPRITLRPNFGIKGTWQKQHIKLAALGGSSAATSGYDFSRNSMRIWGVGPRLGVNTTWHVIRTVSFLADASLSTIWEHFQVERSDAFVETGVGTIYSPHVMNRFYAINPVIEAFLGLRWENWTHWNDYHIAFDAGWEMQYWFFQNRFIRTLVVDSGSGNLSFQGLTVKFRFDF